MMIIAFIKIQFSSPLLFLGGPGMLSRTSLASWDFLMMTSLSLRAVCMRLTLDWFLKTMDDKLTNIHQHQWVLTCIAVRGASILTGFPTLCGMTKKDRKTSVKVCNAKPSAGLSLAALTVSCWRGLWWPLVWWLLQAWPSLHHTWLQSRSSERSCRGSRRLRWGTEEWPGWAGWCSCHEWAVPVGTGTQGQTERAGPAHTHIWRMSGQKKRKRYNC